MHQNFLLIVFVMIITLTASQSLEQLTLWYSPFLMALLVIIFSALIQRDNKNDGP